MRCRRARAAALAAAAALCAPLPPPAAAAAAAVVDRVGWYHVTHEGASVTAEADSARGADRVGRLIKGMHVEALEIRDSADGERVRARIERPVAGWITLGYAAGAKQVKKKGYRWAIPSDAPPEPAKGAGKKKKTVQVGTDDNFFRFRKAPLVLAMFYLPDGADTPKLLAAFGDAAAQLHEHVSFVKIDATEETDLVSEFIGDGYDPRRLPVFIALLKGKVSRYDGPRDADGMVKYMRNVVAIASKPSVHDVKTAADIEQLRTQYGTVSVAFVADGSKEDRAWAAAAERYKAEIVFARSTSADLAKAEGISRPGVKCFPKGADEAVVYRGGIADAGGKDSEPGDAVVRWIRTVTLPLFGEIKQVNFLSYAQEGAPLVWLFTDKGEASAKASAAVAAVAGGALQKRLRFGWADAAAGLGRQVAQKLGAYEKEGDVTLRGGAKDIGRLPALAVTTELRPGREPARPPAVFPADVDITQDAVTLWLDDYLNGGGGEL